VLAEAGFSTASEVSEISGRGVGLNAVKKQVELIGGSVEVHSDPGKGTAVVMRLPLVLALIQVLLVERAGNVYGLPLTSVEEAISLDSSLSLAGRPALDLRGHSVPLTDLAELLGNANVPRAASASAVVLYSSGEKVAVICDKLLGKDEVVVKSLGPLLKSLKPYLGAAILGDGRIALLVDPAVLVHLRAGISSTAAETKTADEQDSTPKVLIVEDSFTVRELQRNILEAAGYRVATTCDGRQALLCLERDDDIGLVLTDVEMPEMDGIELTEAIRGDGKRSTMPVVILTSLEGDDTEQRGIEAGADAYIVKSKFDQQALLETVERLVGR
jgi:two-component system, chemotaxis family, sensor kinase CheA